MSPKKGDEETSGTASGAQSVETIRDILFGEQAREFGGRLDRLEDRIAEARTALLADIASVAEELRRDLSREHETREQEFSDLSHEWGERLSKEVASLREQAGELRGSQASGRRELAELFRELAARLDGDAEGDG